MGACVSAVGPCLTSFISSAPTIITAFEALLVDVLKAENLPDDASKVLQMGQILYPTLNSTQKSMVHELHYKVNPPVAVPTPLSPRLAS